MSNQDESPEVLGLNEYLALPEPDRLKLEGELKEYAKGNIEAMMTRFGGEDLVDNYWDFKGLKEDINFFVGMAPDNEWPCLKAVAKVKAPRQAICDLVVDPERIKDFDDSCESLSCLYKIDDNTEVRHVKGVSYTVVSARDFVVVTHVHDMPDQRMTVISSRSVEHPLDPKPSDYVRGQVYLSGYVIRSITDELTEVSLIVHLGLNGSIPPSVLYYVGEMGPKSMLTKIKQILEDGGKEASYWPSFSIW